MNFLRYMPFLLLLLTAPAGAQDDAARHLVVINKPGAAWDRRAEFREEAREHHRLYRRLADAGDIIVGGRLETETGEPVFGLSAFRRGVDRSAVRALLEADPIVRAGVIELEFLDWSIQLGSLESPASARQPGSS